MVFVFGALIEYSIVNVLARSHKAKIALLRKKLENQEERGDRPEDDVTLKLPREVNHR